eukprot:9796873-Alexandrium_andersonii.AAC.1
MVRPLRPRRLQPLRRPTQLPPGTRPSSRRRGPRGATCWGPWWRRATPRSARSPRRSSAGSWRRSGPALAPAAGTLRRLPRSLADLGGWQLLGL